MQYITEEEAMEAAEMLITEFQRINDECAEREQIVGTFIIED